MSKKHIKTTDLVASIMQFLTEQGYPEKSLYEMNRNFIKIDTFLKYHGTEYFNLYLVDNYVQEVEEKVLNGTLSKSRGTAFRKSAERLIEFYQTNELKFSFKKRGTVYLLNDEYEKLLNNFLDSREFHFNTRGDFEWAIRRYLYFFQTNGKHSISEVSLEDIRKFIIYVSRSMKPSSLHNLFCYIRQFQEFLQNSIDNVPNGYILFCQRVQQHRPVQNHISDEEFIQILNVIDTRTSQGKRDKAIMLLGATVGLRAVDIIKIKLSDINWYTGEICIRQSKTGKILTLPLIEQTGEAIKDYILNGRPKSDVQEIFLRVKAPYHSFKSGVGIEYLFDKYAQKAGVERIAFDGKGFHSLRRLLAKDLLIKETPIRMISEILGHSDLQTASQYLMMNQQMLKECALSLSNIPFDGGVQYE